MPVVIEYSGAFFAGWWREWVGLIGRDDGQLQQHKQMPLFFQFLFSFLFRLVLSPSAGFLSAISGFCCSEREFHQ